MITTVNATPAPYKVRCSTLLPQHPSTATHTATVNPAPRLKLRVSRKVRYMQYTGQYDPLRPRLTIEEKGRRDVQVANSSSSTCDRGACKSMLDP